MQQIINLTNSTIDIGRRTILRSGSIASVVLEETDGGEFDGLPVTDHQLGKVTGLPAPDPDDRILYIVDPLVQRACPDRRDLVIVSEAGGEGVAGLSRFLG